MSETPTAINAISDEDLDALTPEQVATEKARIWREQDEPAVEAFGLEKSTTEPVVALGDSWFDYSIAGFDILDFLQATRKYHIFNHGEAGDTIENMAYGTEYRKKRYRPKPARLNEALDDLKASRARIFLLSAGGNDVAGAELENLLNHGETGRPPTRAEHIEFLVETTYRNAFEALFEKVWKVDKTIHIIGHGYGDAIPDGRAVINIGGYRFVGPWLRPAFTKKRILDPAVQERIIRDLIARLNALLAEFDRRYDHFHALDLRSTIRRNDWENELHLKRSAFRNVANIFDAKMHAVLTGA